MKTESFTNYMSRVIENLKKEERYARLQKVTAFPVSVKSGKQMG